MRMSSPWKADELQTGRMQPSDTGSRRELEISGCSRIAAATTKYGRLEARNTHR